MKTKRKPVPRIDTDCLTKRNGNVSGSVEMDVCGPLVDLDDVVPVSCPYDLNPVDNYSVVDAGYTVSGENDHLCYGLLTTEVSHASKGKRKACDISEGRSFPFEDTRTQADVMERLSASSYVPTKLTLNEPDPMSMPSSVAPSIGKGKGKHL